MGYLLECQQCEILDELKQNEERNLKTESGAGIAVRKNATIALVGVFLVKLM